MKIPQAPVFGVEDVEFFLSSTAAMVERMPDAEALSLLRGLIMITDDPVTMLGPLMQMYDRLNPADAPPTEHYSS